MNPSRNLRQDITYWAPAGQSEFGGIDWSDPVILKGRWEEMAEEIQDKNGNQIVSKARVFLGEGVLINGYLAKGEYFDEDPTTLDDAFEIKQLAKTPDLRALNELTVAYL